jgi:pseudaminic acid biosynthesis-associated methylase
MLLMTPTPPEANPQSVSKTDRTDKNRPATHQEQFWEGAFGDAYTERNAITPQQRAPFFQQILTRAPGIQSVCELGANRGHNLLALRSLNPLLETTGVELNESACAQMAEHPGINVVHAAIQDFSPEAIFDLVYTCGVLIHLNPQDLPAVYQKMVRLSRRYILVNEYFNPSPVEITYRGHSETLFKRDFGGELMDSQPPNALRLVDYGFLWQRDNPVWDNTTWWLFEKT